VTLLVLLGGARSGKSQLAQRLALDSGAPVTFVATATARDDEMAAKIAAHRTERPPAWSTVEEPFDLSGALARVPADTTVVVDCLTLWVANLIDRGDDARVVFALARETSATAAHRRGTTITVSNEVGLGVVPATELGRRYRDVLGEVNRIWSARADRVWLTIAGKALPLAGVEEIARDLAGGG
jgi:adenosyl cobinamide kinase/adenosyl cobinamide phosphate guanylyltransferase